VSAVGRWAATGAALFAVIGVATWNQPGTTTVTGIQSDGAQLFLAKGCSSCHAGPDTTASIGAGFPSLADAPTWAGDRRANLSAKDYLTESIAAPGVFIAPGFQPGESGPTTGMPQLRLTSNEIEALVDYLLQR
jgi:mono/diheme cytochrome c family protein